MLLENSLPRRALQSQTGSSKPAAFALVANVSGGPASRDQKVGCRNSEQKSTDVGEISHASGVHPCNGSEIQDLHQEPEPYQQSRRDEGDSNKDDEEDYGLYAIAGISDQKRSHHRGDGSAGAQARNLRKRVPENLAHHGHHATDQIEEDESAGAHCVFHLAAESPQINHVSDDVHPAGMHEHRRQNRDPAVSVDDANRHDRPSPHEAVAINQLFKENVGIQDNDGDGSQRKTSQRPGCVAEWNESAHLHSAFAKEDSDSVGDGTLNGADDRHLKPRRPPGSNGDEALGRSDREVRDQ